MVGESRFKPCAATPNPTWMVAVCPGQELERTSGIMEAPSSNDALIAGIYGVIMGELDVLILCLSHGSRSK